MRIIIDLCKNNLKKSIEELNFYYSSVKYGNIVFIGYDDYSEFKYNIWRYGYYLKRYNKKK